MNREKLFKGKRVDNGEWVYGYLSEINCINSVVIDDSVGFKTNDEFEVIPESVGLYTGAEDIMGIDIYQNDIVQSGMTGAIYVIMFGEYKTKNSMGIGFWKKGVNTTDRGFFEDSSCLHVKGNVLDNPELLEE